MDLVEQIDLTVNPPLWGAIDRRNRVVCEPAPLIYYHPARERDTVPESSTAMGSRDSAEVDMPGETGVENASPATVATVPPETPVTEGTDIVMDDEMSQQKHLELVAIDSELEKAAKEILDRLGREQLPHFVGDEQIPTFESRVQEWLSNLPADQKDDGGVVATLLVAGAVRKADVNEKFALEAQKSHRLKMAAEAEAKAKELLKKQLAEFDVSKYLVESTKDQRIFYEKVQKLLEDIKTAIEEPFRVDQKVMQDLASLIQDVGKVSEAQGTSQHHAITSIANMTKKINDMSWEMSAGSIDRRCIPSSNRNGPFLRESMRETLLCIRLALMDVLEGTKANHEVLQQSFQLFQRQADGTAKMVEILERMDSREVAREKIDVELKKRQKAALEAQEKAQNAEVMQKAKEDSAKKARLQSELEKANADLENAQKRAKVAQEAVGGEILPTPVKAMPPGPPVPTMTVGPPVPTMTAGTPVPTMPTGPPVPTMPEGAPVPTMTPVTPLPPMPMVPPMPPMQAGGEQVMYCNGRRCVGKFNPSSGQYELVRFLD